ncbi:MAG: hypothetical protein ACRDPW_02815, partial [Mycobacteriales bacterium]
MPPNQRTPQVSEELYYEELDEDSYADEDPAPSRRNKWLSWLFWAGTALAPIAAVLLVMGQGVNPLRAAATLAILGVVCIGLSVTLRDSSSAAHAELAEDLQREVDEVRSELETLRRGVQLTVNRELGQVRGELEAAQQVLRTEATRLPAGNGRTRSSEPAVALAPVRAAARPPTPPRKNLLEQRVAAAAEPTDAAPVSRQLPGPAPRRDTVYGTPARRGAAHEEALPAAQSGVNGRAGSHSSFDSLSSTASHAIISWPNEHRPLSDPYTVEPIREKYAPRSVPSQRSSSSDRPEPAYAATRKAPRTPPTPDRYGS